ncbi:MULTISPECIES: hypothetical protein [unclassified Polaromonas]|uniref:hypothetical protein n=1 Tax=unclassified Polaromonas TaxID=2638319 RepID=UPI000BD5E80C|nr:MULTISPECIES: hypothetical protein [unclassified Polaromonas]OYZ80495.1 MAG: hypothetical protein B7Y09_04765 [Polaromonas sp. 24-63-21]OZA89971.1 MAG: hypothetical protein B7X65_01005 [Polaromonas sp. 39-63-25]HQR97794.1 hypothetical protein [Polaromonas sp.]HQS40889.1 hypothetical protein [Polaromonas sp.]HQS86229.1 hypothetical protein [Polaromonas sp.]
MLDQRGELQAALGQQAPGLGVAVVDDAMNLALSELTGSLSGRYKINHINDESPKHKFRRGSNLVIAHWKSRMSQMAG